MFASKPGAHRALTGQRILCSAAPQKRQCAREKELHAPADVTGGLKHRKRLLSVLPALLSLSVAGKPQSIPCPAPGPSALYCLSCPIMLSSSDGRAHAWSAGQLQASETAAEAFDAAAAAAAAAASQYAPGTYVPGPVEVGWEIWFGAAAGVIPFVIASYEFGKRILIQRRCPTCKGSGLIMRSK
jgi:hypothetical protein